MTDAEPEPRLHYNDTYARSAYADSSKVLRALDYGRVYTWLCAVGCRSSQHADELTLQWLRAHVRLGHIRSVPKLVNAMQNVAPTHSFAPAFAEATIARWAPTSAPRLSIMLGNWRDRSEGVFSRVIRARASRKSAQQQPRTLESVATGFYLAMMHPSAENAAFLLEEVDGHVRDAMRTIYGDHIAHPTSYVVRSAVATYARRVRTGKW